VRQTDWGVHAGFAGKIRNEVEEMVGSHAHQEGDLFGVVVLEGISNDLNGGIPIHVGLHIIRR
jgi:hypothetical protein